MIPVILLSGHLSEERLLRAKEEIRQIPLGDKFHLVIDSSGGDLKPTLDFVDEVGDRTNQDLVGIKIYNAESAAAFIALSFEAETEMRKDAVLAIHRGAVVLEASEIDFEHGQLQNHRMVERFMIYDGYLKQVLDMCGLLQDKVAMAELYGSGWLRLSAEECYKRGIVQRLF